MTSTLTVDFSADAAYLKLSDAQIEETCEVTSAVLVDLDAYGAVVGVEVLTLSHGLRSPLKAEDPRHV